MKKIQIISKSGLITLWVLCLLYQHAQAQIPNACTGIREGNFMEQFKTVILLDQTESFLVELSSSDRRSSIQLEACSYKQVQQLEHAQLPPTYSFHMKSDPEYGVLKVASFGIMNMEDYFSFLDYAFILMNSLGVTDLVLDLRDNQGGHPIFAAQLFSYLTEDDFTYFQRNLDVMEFEPLYNPMQANENHFKGGIYVLINGNCLSTTGHLISLLKYHTGAIFIGEEPGSTYSCNDFSIQYQLPNSRMEVNIPRTTFVTDVTGFKEGKAFPLDHNVQQSTKEYIEGIDSYILYVSATINENMINPLINPDKLD